MLLGMVVGVLIFAAGVFFGTRLDSIARVVRSRPDPLEGKNGFLSYRNCKLRKAEDDDE
jgi:hypothetical protein